MEGTRKVLCIIGFEIDAPADDDDNDAAAAAVVEEEEEEEEEEDGDGPRRDTEREDNDENTVELEEVSLPPLPVASPRDWSGVSTSSRLAASLTAACRRRRIESGKRPPC